MVRHINPNGEECVCGAQCRGRSQNTFRFHFRTRHTKIVRVTTASPHRTNTFRSNTNTKATKGLFALNSHPELLNDPFRSVFWIFILRREHGVSSGNYYYYICSVPPRHLHSRILECNTFENPRLLEETNNMETKSIRKEHMATHNLAAEQRRRFCCAFLSRDVIKWARDRVNDFTQIYNFGSEKSKAFGECAGNLCRMLERNSNRGKTNASDAFNSDSCIVCSVKWI